MEWNYYYSGTCLPEWLNRPWAFPRSPVDLWFSLHWGIVPWCQPSHCWPGETSHVLLPCVFQRPAEGIGPWRGSHLIPPWQMAPQFLFGARLVYCLSWKRWRKEQPAFVSLHFFGLLYSIFQIYKHGLYANLKSHQVRVRLFHTSLCSLSVNFCNTPMVSLWNWLVRGSPTGCTVPTGNIQWQLWLINLCFEVRIQVSEDLITFNDGIC